MKKFKTQFIVIDADVARSSGESENPVSRLSRQCLEQIKESSLVIAMCKELQVEWRRHNSRYASLWHTHMVKSGRTKTFLLTHPSLTWDDISHSEIHQEQKPIAQKDEHLVRLALSVNDCQLIASNDEKSREIFAAIHSEHIRKELAWFVPTKSSEFEMQQIFSGYMDKPMIWHF
jgi:hypothetical protein